MLVDKSMIKNKKVIGDAERVWKMIEAFGSYAFNKSHAVAYSIISYYDAKMWARHKEKLLEWHINNDNADKVKVAMNKCYELGYKLQFPEYTKVEKRDEYKLENSKIYPMMDLEGSWKNLSQFICDPSLTKSQKLSFIAHGIFDKIVSDRKGLYTLVQSLMDKHIQNPVFPDCNDLISFLENMAIVGALRFTEDENKVEITVIKTRSEVNLEIFKMPMPLEREEYRIDQDLKNYRQFRSGILSKFDWIDEDRMCRKYYILKDRLIEKLKDGSKNHYQVMDDLKKEVKNILNDQVFSQRIARIMENEYTVLFKEAVHNKYSDYLKVIVMFDDGVEKVFYVRDKELISKIQKFNKNKLVKLHYKVDNYVSVKGEKQYNVIWLPKVVDIWR